MKKKSLILIIAFLGFFFANNSLAEEIEPLQNPQDLETVDILEGQAGLSWSYPSINNPNLKQFKILWKKENDTQWNAAYPSKVEGQIDYTYYLSELLGGTNYEWRIKAEGISVDYDSSYVPTTTAMTFTTSESTWEEEDPEEEEENGDENEENGDENEENGDENVTGIVDLGNYFEGVGSFADEISSLMDFAVLVSLGVGSILISYSGFILITRQDKPEAVTQAKKILMWTIGALVLILFSKGIPSIVEGLF